MTSPEAARGPHNEVPRSLEQAADFARKRVEGMQDSFKSQYRSAIEAKEALRDIERRTMAIVSQGVQLLDRARALMVRRKRLGEEAAVRVVSDVRNDRDRDLLEKDWHAVADFHRKVAGYLRAQADDREELTDYELRAEARRFIEEAPCGSYIMRHYGDEVMDMLGSVPDPARHEALKKRVYEKVDTDPALSESDKESIFSKARDTLDLIRMLSAPNHDVTPLSPQSIDGIMGHVLSEADMRKVFAGDMSPIEALPAAGVRVVFADGERTFYHDAPGEKVPKDILKLLKGGMPRHILFVHYRTDDDMIRLIRDMSDGERLMAPRRGTTDDMIELEGCSKDEECVIHRKPADITLEQLWESPMRHLDHHIVFTYPGKERQSELKRELTPPAAGKDGEKVRGEGQRDSSDS